MELKLKDWIYSECVCVYCTLKRRHKLHIQTSADVLYIKQLFRF